MLRVAQDYAAAARSVQALGGEVVRVSATCLPDVLVCTSVRSRTYQVCSLQACFPAMARCAGCALLRILTEQRRLQALRSSKAGTPVLRPAWLEACLASGSRVRVQQWRPAGKHVFLQTSY